MGSRSRRPWRDRLNISHSLFPPRRARRLGASAEKSPRPAERGAGAEENPRTDQGIGKDLLNAETSARSAA